MQRRKKSKLDEGTHTHTHTKKQAATFNLENLEAHKEKVEIRANAVEKNAVRISKYIKASVLVTIQ